MRRLTRLRVSDAIVSVGFLRPDGVPDGSVVSVFRVPPEVAGQRLDVFLQSQLKRTSRTRTQYIVSVSAFDVKGKRLRSNHRVQAEEHVMLWRALKHVGRGFYIDIGANDPVVDSVTKAFKMKDYDGTQFRN